jgi:hypothetical protein
MVFEMKRKIKLGYLDEDYDHRSSFFRFFNNIFDVIAWDDFGGIRTLEQLRKEIDEKEIDVLAVDYKLAENGDVCYNGDEVVQMLYDSKRYFPVFMVTSHVTSALSKMDNVFLINDKSNFFRQDNYSDIVQKIEGAVAAYHRVVEQKSKRARELEIKQMSAQGLDAQEENELLNIHLDLNAIDPLANPIKPDMLQTKSLKDLQELVKNSREILKSLN